MFEIPLPMLKPNAAGATAPRRYLSRYQNALELYGKETTAKDMPSFTEKQAERALKHRSAGARKRDRSVSREYSCAFKAATVRGRIRCGECGRHRAIYSTKKLSKGDKARADLLESLVERTQYVCGMALFEPEEEVLNDDDKKKVFLVRCNTTCAHGMHVDYLRAKVNVRNEGYKPMFPPCCAHCGSEEEEELLSFDASADERVGRGCRRVTCWPLCRGCEAAGKAFVQNKRKVTAMRAPGRRVMAPDATDVAEASATSGSAGASRGRRDEDTAMDTAPDA